MKIRGEAVALPEGRSRNAMKLKKILFSFQGRLGRGVYWVAILALVAAVLVLTFAPFLLDNEKAAVLMVALTSQIVWIFSLWPIMAVGSKRLHDRNKSGWWLLIFWVLPFLLFFGGFGIDFVSDPEIVRNADFTTGLIMMTASLPLALWGIVELGVLPGDKGPNRYDATPHDG
jgi:uncharacterized membrane protein YhaH (DUF805 family)